MTRLISSDQLSSFYFFFDKTFDRPFSTHDYVIAELLTLSDLPFEGAKIGGGSSAEEAIEVDNFSFIIFLLHFIFGYIYASASITTSF